MTEEQLLEQERAYSFTAFTHADAARFTQAVVSLAKARDAKPVGIRVVMDGVIVCQYLMDGKDSDEWLNRNRKQRTVERSGHSSLWVRVCNDASQSYAPWREEGCAICGGGFPLVVNGAVRGCLGVSGLSHEEDHDLILDAISKIKAGKGPVCEGSKTTYSANSDGEQSHRLR